MHKLVLLQARDMRHRIEHLAEVVTGATTDTAPELDESVRRHLRWLLHGDVRTGDGMLAAWTDGPTAAHAYQESTGYLISLLGYLYPVTGQDRFRAEASRAVTALTDHLGDAHGCGRDGVVYLFDSAVCLRALGTFFTVFEDLARDDEFRPTLAAMDRLALTCGEMFRRREACARPTNGSPRWSESFSAHLIKAANLASPWVPAWREVIDELVSRFFFGGRFYADPGHERVYAHASCYASEGLLARPDLHPEERAQIAPFLARIQREDGGIPAWWPEDAGPVTDATAQAVRIWQCTDAAAFADNIEAGISFLDAMALPGGGFRYSPLIAHANSWSTIFAVQALVWHMVPPGAEWIV